MDQNNEKDKIEKLNIEEQEVETLNIEEQEVEEQEDLILHPTITAALLSSTSTSLNVYAGNLELNPSQYSSIYVYCATTNERSPNLIPYGNFPDSQHSGKYRTTSWEFKNLTPGTRYYFRPEVTTKGGVGYRGYQTIYTTPNPVRPDTPSITVASVNGRVITWRIATGSNTERIEIERSWASAPASSSLGSNSVYFYEQTLPADGTQYSIRVRASNTGYGWGLWSARSYATTDTPLVVGSVNNLVTSNVTTSSFRLDWSAASNATGYQVAYRVDGTTTWTTVTTSQRYRTISNLAVSTYYQYRVRGYNGSVYGNWTSYGIVRTEQEVPSLLNWRTMSSGGVFNVTAREWNTLTSKINAWREYKGLSNTNFTTATSGAMFTAVMFNQARNSLANMNPPTSPPSTVSSGSIVTAAMLNRLATSIDSLR